MENMNSKSKRIQAKGWFLTYPMCDRPQSELLEYFKTLEHYRQSVVCQEKHKTGEYHLHAFLKYDRKVDWGSTKWDFKSSEGIVYHGNYQSAKSWSRVEQYIKKDGNYITDGFAANTAFTKKHVCKEMLTMDPNLAVEQNLIPYYRFECLIKNQYLYSIVQNTPYCHSSVRGLWIYGPSGTGKSHWAREYLVSKYSCYYLKPQNKWFDGYMNQKAILMDDFNCKELGTLLKQWLDKYPCAGEVKGGKVALGHELFVITSNYLPESIWSLDSECAKAIRRRCFFKEMNDVRLESILPDNGVFVE